MNLDFNLRLNPTHQVCFSFFSFKFEINETAVQISIFIMDFLKNRSIVLEYYPVTLLVIFIISVFLFIFKKKKEINVEVIDEVESIEGKKKL